MAEKKTSWDDIPSLDGFEVDWEYKPKNPLGRRSHSRIKNTELYPVLDVSTIPVKIVAKNFEEKGCLIDISPAGMTVSLDSMLGRDQQVMVGLFLGQQKIVSKGRVKYVLENEGKYKTGLEFEALNSEYADYITGLLASRISDL